VDEFLLPLHFAQQQQHRAELERVLLIFLLQTLPGICFGFNLFGSFFIKLSTTFLNNKHSRNVAHYIDFEQSLEGFVSTAANSNPSPSPLAAFFDRSV